MMKTTTMTEEMMNETENESVAAVYDPDMNHTLLTIVDDGEDFAQFERNAFAMARHLAAKRHQYLIMKFRSDALTPEGASRLWTIPPWEDEAPYVVDQEVE